MKKSLVIDSGAIISMVTNNLLWTVRHLAKKYKGDFLITESVKEELINYPMTTKKFKFEAFMINDLILEKHIKLIDNDAELERLSSKLMYLANNIYIAKNRPISVLQKAETDTLALAILMKSDAMLIDERTLRLLVEDPNKLSYILGHRLHTKVSINKSNLNQFSEMVKKINILRSTEIVTIAYEMGLLNRYISSGTKLHSEYKKPLLEGVLWALKLKGCSISEEEINEILRFEKV